MGTRAGEEGEGVRCEATEPEEASARRALPAVSVNGSSYTKGPGEPGSEAQRCSGLSGCLGEHVAQMNEKYLSVSLCSPSSPSWVPIRVISSSS